MQVLYYTTYFHLFINVNAKLYNYTKHPWAFTLSPPPKLTFIHFHWAEVLNLPNGEARQPPCVFSKQLPILQVWSPQVRIPTLGLCTQTIRHFETNKQTDGRRERGREGGTEGGTDGGREGGTDRQTDKQTNSTLTGEAV